MAKSISELTTLTENPPSKVDNKIRLAWNDFLLNLEKKGVRGNPVLDKGGVGYQMFDNYVKDNPGTPLSRETLPVIRGEMNNYRNWVLDRVKQRKATLSEGVNENTFMKHIVENEKTADPNLPGSQMSSTAFPSEYLESFMNNKLIKKERLGFSDTAKK